MSKSYVLLQASIFKVTIVFAVTGKGKIMEFTSRTANRRMSNADGSRLLSIF